MTNFETDLPDADTISSLWQTSPDLMAHLEGDQNIDLASVLESMESLLELESGPMYDLAYTLAAALTELSQNPPA